MLTLESLPSNPFRDDGPQSGDEISAGCSASVLVAIAEVAK